MRKVNVENTLVANTTAIIAEVFKSPTEDSVLASFKEEGATKSGVTMPAPRVQVPAKETVVGSHFKMIFLSVLLLTAGTLIAEIVLVWVLNSPTASQQNLIAGLESVWKGGVGAILGLLGGKAT
jgi:hypothetical protein